MINAFPTHGDRFRSAWLKHPVFKDWLSRCKDSDDKAYCTVCNKELCAGKSELMRHQKGKKHQKSMEKSGFGTGTVFRSRCDINIKSSDHSDLSTVLDEHGISHVLHIVDLRSDTVTQPCREMKSAMVSAALGDDAFTEDPTVKTLEVKVATLLEKEAALFVPSGTMANLVCVMAHCWHRGSEVIVGDKSHINISAKGGMAQIGGIHHHTIKNKPDGTFSLDEVQSIVRNNNDNWSSQFLVCVENTHNMVGGKALPIHWMDELGSVCSQLDVLVHCDGARLMNAAVALGTNPARLVQSCDSVSLCLNKGLGTPMGSVIAGGKDFISRATKIRKILGGGLHQAGFVAAAGMWALDHQVPKLSADHAHARAIAQCVHEEHSSAITVDLKSVQTNIALLHCDNIRVDAKKLCQRLASVTDTESDELEEQVVVMMMPVTDTSVRFMTHCDVRKDDVKAVIKKLRYVIQEYDNMMYLEYKVAT
ncbi:putative low-specificity L-threonine aldolase 1 [Chionoecetes opilio]|uniref:Putative low-specificity L-threonine aldolase 1 n=1 Tax=Chionoecetes opilio TaxID=41210 RepID=A0A8J4YLJ0_CHIOP|nr:putative low-specificity L-threonine aldolase 1 [Chionoecetes opilio]